MNWVKYSFLILMLTTVVTPVSAQKTVWTAEDIKRVEIESLFDLFTLTSNWINATNDDATIQFSRNALAGTGGAWWPVYLNGMQLHLQTWNTLSLHSSPVSLSQLDSVVIIESPMMYEGVFTEKGSIFLYTRNHQSGVKVEGNFSFGNRSGDPGPFVYTEFTSPNIERMGPLIDSQILYRNKNFGLQAGFNAFYHSATDGILQYRRMAPFEFGEGPYRHEKIISSAVYLRADTKTGSFNHQVQTGFNQALDFLFTDLYGVEIPVDLMRGFIALNGSGGIFDQVELSYGLSHNMNDTKNHPNKNGRWLTWYQNVSSVKTDLNYSFKKGFQKIGLEAEYYSLNDDLKGEVLDTDLMKLSHQFKYKLSSNLDIFSNTMVVKGQKSAFKENVGLQFHITPSQSMMLNFTYSQRLPEEDNSLWYWIIEKGFGSDTLGGYHFGELPEKSKFLQTSLGWKKSLSDHTELKISSVLNKNIDEYLFNYELVPRGQGIETGGYNFINDLNASVLRFPFTLMLSLNPKIKQEFNYTGTIQLSGNEALFDMMPSHKFSFNINWKPVNSLKIWSRIQVQSKTYWASAEPIDGLEANVYNNQFEKYSSSTSSRFLLDFGMKKYFWENRVAFSLDMRNLTDQQFRHHPISQRHALTLFLRAHLNIP